MIDNKIFLERFLQNYRFKMIKPYLFGDVLDFGGNKGELKKLVAGNYLAINHDRSLMKDAHFDTIVSLAVIEHIDVNEVFKIFKEFKNVLNKNGGIFITTPTKIAKPVLEFLAFIKVISKENIIEHKHYWNKNEIYDLAEKTGFTIKKYRLFQMGFNQLVIFTHPKSN